MNIVSLDLEYNKPSFNIIQVGIVVGNLKTGEILKEYESCVKVNEEIDPFITTLTGITIQDIENGKLLGNIYQDLIKIHTDFECFRNPLTWGGGDSQDLRKELNLDDEKFLFGRRWIDVKTVYISYMIANDKSRQSGLSKSMARLGLQFKGKKHTAKDDALNTFRIYYELLKRLKNENL